MRSKTQIEKIIYNPIIQTLVIFISGGWIILEILEYFIGNFGLDESARNIVLIILISVLPVVIFFAWYISRKDRKLDESSREEPPETTSRIPERGFQKVIFSLTRLQIFIPALLILLAIGISVAVRMRHQSKILWAKGEAIPEISRLMEERRWKEAYELAEQAERYISKDSMLIRLWPGISSYISIRSEPEGSQVYFRPYRFTGEDWQYLGETPIDSIRFPRGIFRLKLDKEGYQTRFAGNYSNSLNFLMEKEESHPHNMVHIPGGKEYFWLAGLDHLGEIEMENYLIDKYEVTNRQFKEFIDHGGYEKQVYWTHEFKREGNSLAWEEAMTEFQDATGRPGPSTWEVGDYPDGMDNFPVTGISWYEAAAYAEFAGKSLPTIYHWNFASGKLWSDKIVPLSNFDRKGPSPVGAYAGMSPYGSFDMAGNVREWCWNESRSQRIIMGGSWNDNIYMFTSSFALLPFDRSETNGFRCMQYLGPEETREMMEKPIEIPRRDFLNEPKVSDEVFAMFLKQYSYDRTDLHSHIETVREEEDYTREEISFDAAYGNERMKAYLFLPKHGKPPYQTVVFFPGGGSLFTRSSENLGFGNMNTLLVKSGRAVLCPVYKSTYERGDEWQTHWPDETHNYKEHVIMWSKDLSRSIDYLETREEIDTSKLVYFGVSWGGSLGATLAAIEPRIKTSVLIYAGLYFQRTLPEVDPIHYLPRIKTPVIMLNGKYDFIFPHETSQLPFFSLLGTPKENKDILLYEFAHTIPVASYSKEMLSWLDKYLGPIN